MLHVDRQAAKMLVPTPNLILLALQVHYKAPLCGLSRALYPFTNHMLSLGPGNMGDLIDQTLESFLIPSLFTSIATRQMPFAQREPIH